MPPSGFSPVPLLGQSDPPVLRQPGAAGQRDRLVASLGSLLHRDLRAPHGHTRAAALDQARGEYPEIPTRAAARADPLDEILAPLIPGQPVAGAAGLGDFDEGMANGPAISDAHGGLVGALDGQVLAESAGADVVAAPF